MLLFDKTGFTRFEFCLIVLDNGLNRNSEYADSCSVAEGGGETEAGRSWPCRVRSKDGFVRVYSLRVLVPMMWPGTGFR